MCHASRNEPPRPSGHADGHSRQPALLRPHDAQLDKSHSSRHDSDPSQRPHGPGTDRRDAHAIPPALLQSHRSLDWLNFFVAAVQAGFGPFVVVYLATESWTPAEIGQLLSVGTTAAILSQLPGGVLVDRLRDKRMAAGGAGLAVAISAILFATMSTKIAIMLAQVLQGFASCVLGPALAALSLGVAGRAGLGERLGRNTRFASLGAAIASLVLGACGTYICHSAVFWLTASLMLPGLLALRMIQRAEPAPRILTAPPGPRAV